MKAKELIINLLDREMNEDVFIDTGDGLKKIRLVVSVVSETNPRHYISILTE